MLKVYEGRFIMPTIVGRRPLEILSDPEEILNKLMPASAKYQAERRRLRGDPNWTAPLRKARNQVLSIYPLTTDIPRPWREAALSGFKILPGWHEVEVLEAAIELRNAGLSRPHLTGPRPTYFLSLEGQKKLIEMMPWIEKCPKKRWANVIALFRDALPLASDTTKFWVPASFEVRDDSAETVFVNPRFAVKLSAWIEQADYEETPWWLPTPEEEIEMSMSDASGDEEEVEVPGVNGRRARVPEIVHLKTGDKVAGPGFKGTVLIKDIPTDISFGKPKDDYKDMIRAASEALGGKIPVARMPQLGSMFHIGRLGYAGLQVLRGFQPKVLRASLDRSILMELDMLASVEVV
jgi:hypothetical protein